MDFWRQLDICSPQELRFPITVIGAGGIGSPAVLALAKMGASDLKVFDGDLVETHNIPNQFYRLEDVGSSKVKALQEIVDDFTGAQIGVREERFEGNQALRGIVIGAVDSMVSRSAVWKGVRHNPNSLLLIDARMGAEVCLIYTIRPNRPADITFYESTLYTDEEAVSAPCTERAIIYNTLMIASLVLNQVKKFARGEELKKEIIFDLRTLTLLAQ